MPVQAISGLQMSLLRHTQEWGLLVEFFRCGDLAERGGFEPPTHLLGVYTISSRARSTTPAPLLAGGEYRTRTGGLQSAILALYQLS